MYIRVLCTIIYQSDDLALSASDRNRPVFLTGCALLSAFTLGCSLSRSGPQLITFRVLQGLAMSLCMPTAVSLITNNTPAGRRRNMAFAFLGGGQPVGFALGLVPGGVLVDSLGCRYGYYISCVVNALIFVGAYFSIPLQRPWEGPSRRRRLIQDIDWAGVLIASTCIAMLSYILALITSSSSTIHHPQNTAILAIAGVLMPSFVVWVGRQERLGRPAIIPNSIWRNRVLQAYVSRSSCAGPNSTHFPILPHWSFKILSTSLHSRRRCAFFLWWSFDLPPT